MDEWRPIETAPKDGTHIWAYIPRKTIPQQNGKRLKHNCAHQREIWWCDGPVGGPKHTPPQHAIVLAEKHAGYWTASRSGFRPIEGAPTHWMHLPPPPPHTERTG